GQGSAASESVVMVTQSWERTASVLSHAEQRWGPEAATPAGSTRDATTGRGRRPASRWSWSPSHGRGPHRSSPVRSNGGGRRRRRRRAVQGTRPRAGVGGQRVGGHGHPVTGEDRIGPLPCGATVGAGGGD